ncbi:class II aldolase/adducin family protein [Duganella sp. CT11-25]|uniref:class II aldolase/adducin family protein n=1 Tax=unclassified Duganella TaxID=2636909 RepID=UPI0039AF6E54
MIKDEQISRDLAQCHRLMDYFGMSDTIYAHASARLGDAEDGFLMTPFGLLFDEIGADDLLNMDSNGRVLRASPHPPNAAGFVIHSAIYSQRKDVACVIHSHSAAGVAVSALADGLLPLSQAAMEFYGRISYHEYEGLAVDLAERASLARDLGNNNAMILRNHGVIVTGASVPAAFERLYYLEQACKIQLQALACNRPLTIPPPEVCERTAKQYEITGMLPKGTRLWTALGRMLQRHGAGGRPGGSPAMLKSA